MNPDDLVKGKIYQFKEGFFRLPSIVLNDEKRCGWNGKKIYTVYHYDFMLFLGNCQMHRFGFESLPTQNGFVFLIGENIVFLHKTFASELREVMVDSQPNPNID